MPNRKPQVMWMAKSPEGALVYYSASLTRQKAIWSIQEATWVKWDYFKQIGWQIVKVEVRETKKGVK